VAAVIGHNFCVHGDLSPHLQYWGDIARISKIGQNCDSENPNGLALLWSDPSPEVPEFGQSPRGCGFLFGEDAVSRFAQDGVHEKRIIRGHQRCSDGFSWPFTESGRVLTVFSSCDYCNTGNDAAVVTVNDVDYDVNCKTFSPISGDQRHLRRVQFPDWLLQSEMREAKVSLLDDLPVFIEV
jgi:diadenosine tetraphosphatase ApaH/serine/threonine PP2A family protein phosphatase